MMMKMPVDILYDWTSENWDFKARRVKKGVDSADFNKVYYVYAFLKGNARSGLEFFPGGIVKGDGLEIAEAICDRL